MSKASDAGKSFLAGVFAKLPEAVRGQAEAAFAAAEAEAALEVIGTGALAQPEINRKFDELKSAQEALEAKQAEVDETYTKQVKWWETNEAKAKGYDQLKPEYDKLKAGGGNVGDKTENPSVEELRKEFNDRFLSLQQEGVGVMAFMSDLAVRHFAEFGEKPDMTSLLNDKNLGKPMPDGRTYGLVQAYETKYGEQIKARHEKEEKSRIDKLVEERYAERMKGQPQPFPLRDSAPSVLDVLESSTDKPDAHTVDTATDLYEKLQSARG